jgi:hypothetical protein
MNVQYFKSGSLYIPLATVTMFIALSGCNSGGNSTQVESKDSIVVDTTSHPTSQNIFYSVPSPMQIGRLLQESGATYDKKMLNPLSNVSSYSNTESKALNLGVYGANLSSCVIFDQTQETMLYFKAANKLAEELNITGSFSSQAMKRVEGNISNKDSLYQIISQLFVNSNETLQNNDQSNVIALILTGGFVETLYAGTQTAKTAKDNTALAKRIGELKGALNNLIAILSIEKQDKTVAGLLMDLKAIAAVYDESKHREAKPIVVKTDASTGVTTLDGTSDYTLTKEQLADITSKVEALRNKIIKP